MLRYAFSLILLASLLAAPPAAAYDDTVNWRDKAAMTPALQDKLDTPQNWHRLDPALTHLSPRPAPPLEMKTACIVNLESAFYDELQRRGAAITAVSGCRQVIIWYAAGQGLTYTFAELQKQYLPIDSDEEAAAFLLASGVLASIPWYAAHIDGALYIMTEEPFCGGLGHRRRIFRMAADGTNTFLGMITEPPPKGAGCR